MVAVAGRVVAAASRALRGGNPAGVGDAVRVGVAPMLAAVDSGRRGVVRSMEVLPMPGV